MTRCIFITSSNKVCAKITVATHEHCRFHSSVLERQRHRLITPEWALRISPKQADSNHHFNSFPKDNYDYYEHDHMEPGLIPYTVFKSSDYTDVMPETGCRFMITMGRLKGYYCACPNEEKSDFCCYHRSVIELPDTAEYPVPIWTQCIIPKEVDSRLPMFVFPWKNYNLMDLLFLDFISAPVHTKPPSPAPITNPVVSKDPVPITPVPKEPMTCPRLKPSARVPVRSRRGIKQPKGGKRSKHKEYTMYYECPGDCQEPGCNCKVLMVPMQVIDFEPRQNLYRELDHGYIVKESNGIVVIQGIFDENIKKMRGLTVEEKEHALEHGMTVV